MKTIVCGPPYSGLGVVGRALADAGIFLDGPLGMAVPTDASGLYINRRIAALHNDILRANGVTWTAPARSPMRIDETHRDRARAAIADSMGEREDWAVIDPRAALFHDLWDDVVPDARWVFIVREPAVAAWALMRRPALSPRDRSPLQCLRHALRVWTWYCQQIAEFCQRAGERSALLFAPTDFNDAGDAHLAALSEGTLRVNLSNAWHPMLLRDASPRWVRLTSSAMPEVRATWNTLREIRARQLRHRSVAELRQGRRRVVGAPRPVVCLASRRRLTLSETFVRDHLLRLPASMRWLVGPSEEPKRDRNDLPINSLASRAAAAALTEVGYPGQAMLARGLARYLRRERVQVVLAEFGPVATGFVDACAATGIPLVAHFHGYDAYKRSTLVDYGERYQRLFEVASAIVVVSRDMASQLQSLGAPPEKIFWNPCGVDTDAFVGADPASADPIFVSVGRFVEKKAPHNVLLAFQHAIRQRPDARLVMIGDGHMLNMCRQLCDVLGLSERVRFTGALSPPEVAGYLKNARAFVQHSMRDSDGNAEGTPVSVLEAGATGLPVVSTRHMGIADVVLHGETGFLVEEGDVRGMGDHLITLCDDAELAGAMGRRGRARICAEFSMERSIGRLWSVLESAATGQPVVSGVEVRTVVPGPGVAYARQ